MLQLFSVYRTFAGNASHNQLRRVMQLRNVIESALASIEEYVMGVARAVAVHNPTSPRVGARLLNRQTTCLAVISHWQTCILRCTWRN